MNRRHCVLLLGLVAGCSTHPLVDVCDFFQPGKLGPNKVQPYGGVGIPQGPIVAVAPNISVGPPSPFGGGGIVPPPVPLPGNPTPQLQPPMGDFVPPIPPPPPPPNR